MRESEVYQDSIHNEWLCIVLHLRQRAIAASTGYAKHSVAGDLAALDYAVLMAGSHFFIQPKLCIVVVEGS
jgi:hypothetical protein